MAALRLRDVLTLANTPQAATSRGDFAQASPSDKS
jgi:hypothetical protein